MRLRRRTRGGEVKDSHSFLAYDETVDTAEADEAAWRRKIRQIPFSGADRPGFEAEMLKSVLSADRTAYGCAYGHPHRAYITVRENSIEFEFDADCKYTEQELKRLMQLAAAAKRRCRFP